jgi:AcrR family transcriptional regulator
MAAGGVADGAGDADAGASADKLTAKGRRTRLQLIEGARRAFAQSANYVDTRVSDITDQANVAYGSFYTYFSSKEMLFRELATTVVLDMYDSTRSSYRGDDPQRRIASANARWFGAYRNNARMMAVIEQAAALYPEFHELRRELRARFVERIAANVLSWQRSGLVSADLDPLTSAHALLSMTDNFCYVYLVLGEQFEEQVAIETLNTLWVRGLGLHSSTTS